MNKANEAGQYIIGQIDALTLVVGVLVAHLSPEAAAVLFARCVALREQAGQGVPLGAYVQGFLSTGDSVATALKVHPGPGRTPGQSGPAPH